MNIKQIVDRISDPDKPKKGNFRLSLKKASIENMDLCLERLDHRDPEHGIDFSHMHLYGITARVDDFTIDGQAIYTSIVAFSARERSGFVLNHLAGRFYMTQGCLGFENASIITPRSNVNFPFVSLAGDSWAQYKDFIGEVRIDASMRNTTVSTDDIAFFAPKLRDWHVDFTDVNVEVAGVVSDFTGRIRSMQIGEGTTLVADASVKGLPDIRKTCRFPACAPRPGPWTGWPSASRAANSRTSWSACWAIPGRSTSMPVSGDCSRRSTCGWVPRPTWAALTVTCR